MKATGTRPKIIVSGDGRGVVGHAGARLLTDVADAAGLTGAFSEALSGLRQRRGGHDPGRVAVDLAVTIADGGEAIGDLAVLRDQSGLFGAVASDATAWRVLSGLDSEALVSLRMARARAREVAWAQMGETRDGIPAATAAGQPVPGLVLDLDASIVICHSEKESATRTWKKTFGYHPLFCFLDNTREALSGLLREGRAGSNTTADHITVLNSALEQIPDAHRYGTEILIRCDSAGCTQGFLAHIRSLREHGINTFFSVGVAITEPIRDAIRAATGWIPAIDADGEPRDGAQVCEITGLVPDDGYPEGTRFIVRRERPHPGAQLSLFDTIEGFRHQVTATDTPPGRGSIQFLEARHRAHARVEDRIRTGKDTGFGRFPSRVFAINAAWLELALTGIDLLAWTQHLLLDGDLATAEPKKLRYRLLHVPARITRSARRTKLRVAEGWPWAEQLVTAFTRLAALPQPVT
ncbi:IS1380 family transposase [Micromonospora sp. WMMD718]|uniref:IS1380 family transposase n=2 Tax=Micromonospora TaxID=1873 RepID=A0AAU7QUK5_9ACTN|nr:MULTISPECIES: IS1380 family transposase [unclassified Micromonospora]MDG4750619.1 IS1380 family transposase [Micromonospora sp. WMMD718]MDG4750871.1 IS1380 family transposase [Micromonospora sp. WMMD718]MDG4752795.1 IS1380 family transposase [Micromonospora sp. WMMD718]MDG4752869.1 IS1380 family transposase [Micromonospora sp. WMMD718]MDG4753180.1 IS1380 family transposase [Micromonospora sp. WMMD718]